MKFYLMSSTVWSSPGTRYEKDGKLVEFDTFEEADVLSDKLTEETDYIFWPHSDDPRNKLVLLTWLLPSADERDERLRQELVATQVVNEVQEASEVAREATPPIPDPTAPESEASNANCDLTGSWTSVLYQLPGQPPITDRLTFVHDSGNRHTVVMTYDDGSTLRESAIRDGCTLNETVESNRYAVRENGQISLSDRNGFIRVCQPE